MAIEKSADAFRTISEVADDLDVPKHVLRFWEGKFLQLRPLKRGGGRRYYRRTDIDLLKGIRRLLYDEGYTIKGVQKVLREHGIEFVKGIGGPEAASSPAEEARASRRDYQNGSGGEGHVTSRASGRGRATPETVALSRELRQDLRKALGALERARKLLTPSSE
jgi:DNA-binding transcriptional MerR regulator